MTTDIVECPGCGSHQEEREEYIKDVINSDVSTALTTCPHCGVKKCCLCDLGNDVKCISCGDGSELDLGDL
jgi:DNA-directed RNA polymerase subunit RPC12/RpoP